MATEFVQEEVAEWLSRDPAPEKLGLNLYWYVHNHPVESVDPLGLSEATNILYIVPVAGTVYNIAITPDGAQVSDYKVVLPDPTLCAIDPQEAEQKAREQIANQAAGDVGSYAGLNTAHEFVDGAVGLLTSGTVVGTIAAGIDGVVDLGVSLYRIGQIINASSAAEKKCHCPPPPS